MFNFIALKRLKNIKQSFKKIKKIKKTRLNNNTKSILISARCSSFSFIMVRISLEVKFFVMSKKNEHN